MNLASRGKRFAAQLIDALALTVLLGLSMLQDVLPAPLLVLFAVGALALSLTQLVLLARRGQTLGKMALGLRIVRKDTGENGGFVVNVLLRSALSSLLGLNPLYFLIDSALIYRADRRCLHDLLAGTIVVDASSSVPHSS
jgi:uncharacterized RDD family membrane protein YckC